MKRWSSFYHTIPARNGNDETYALGLTDEMMRQGKIVSYFDISQMEPRTLAYDSKCKNFIKNYEEGKDVYLALARIHNPNATDKELKAMRGTFKRLNLNKPGLSIINAINCWELPTEISGQSAAKLTL